MRGRDARREMEVVVGDKGRYGSCLNTIIMLKGNSLASNNGGVLYTSHVILHRFG